MLINQLNLNHLRLFYMVYKTRSMSIAAKELHLTQSGVSQHIKNLEHTLGNPLFDRVKNKLIPTQSAKQLFDYCEENLIKLEHALQSVSAKSEKIDGVVSIGMPAEFGHDQVIPYLGRIHRVQPDIRFDIRIGLAPEMNQLLLNGELDFAFVDHFLLDKRIETTPVYDEVLSLCISTRLFNKMKVGSFDRKFYESLPYVTYDPSGSLLHSWFQQHYNFKNLRLNVKANVSDAYSISQLIKSEVGAGILPNYLMDSLGKKVTTIKGSNKIIKNEISLAKINARKLSPAADYTYDSIKKYFDDAL